MRRSASALVVGSSDVRRPRIAVFVVVLSLAVACGNQRASNVETMRNQLKNLEVPSGLRPVGERVNGDLGDCVESPCLRVTQYYVSDLTPTEACAALEPALQRWAQDVKKDPTRTDQVPSCGFSARRDRFQVAAAVAPDRPLAAGDGHIGDERITEPHQSVITVSLVTA